METLADLMPEIAESLWQTTETVPHSEVVAKSATIDVLMATHITDDVEHLEQALMSLVPSARFYNKLILVADGMLKPSQMKIIRGLERNLKITLVQLPVNVGLGRALNVGTKASSADYLMRMDSDDICVPERLETLRTVLYKDTSISVIGSYIEEFIDDPRKPMYIRPVPLTHEEIVRRLKRRCVMNHVSCLINRRALLSVGGYQGGRGFAEDWWLWMRLAASGYKFANVSDCLVKVRVGNGFLARRRGRELFKQDWVFGTHCLKEKYFTLFDFLSFACVKLAQRLSPVWALKFMYARLRKSCV